MPPGSDATSITAAADAIPEKDRYSTIIKNRSGDVVDAANATVTCIQNPVLAVRDVANKINNSAHDLAMSGLNVAKGVYNQVRTCGVSIPGLVKGTAEQVVNNIDMVGDAFKRNIKGIANHVKDLYDVFRDVPNPVNKIKHKIKSIEDQYHDLVAAAQMLQQMAKDKRFRQAMGRIGTEGANVVLGALDAAQPAIQQVLDKGKGIAVDAATQAGKTASLAIRSALKPLITAIPILGPIVMAIMTSTEALNNVVDTCAMPTAWALNTVELPVNTIGDTVIDVRCQTKAVIEEAKKAIHDATTAAAASQAGGQLHKQQLSQLHKQQPSQPREPHKQLPGQPREQQPGQKNLDHHRVLIRQQMDKTRRRIAATCRTAYGKTRRHAITI